MSKRIGTTIITTNAPCRPHGDVITGRMGLSYVIKVLHVIAPVIHTSTDEIGALTGKLTTLEGTHVRLSMPRA